MIRGMQGSHGVTGVWNGGWNEAELSRWAAALRAQLTDSGVTLGLVFLAPSLFPHAEEVLEVLRVHGRIPCLVGSGRLNIIVINGQGLRRLQRIDACCRRQR